MTFGEKLYKLRKTHGFSQEALAEKLNTSRQAISKWENNNGYPETEKLILISNIFQISLDDLLINDIEPGSKEEKNIQEETKGFYVSRETANGFLFYYKRKILLLAAACGIALGCNSVSYSSTEYDFFASRVAPLLTTISIMTLLSVVIYITLKQNPYRVLRKKELVFDEAVRKELQEEFFKMKKILVCGIAFGLVLFGTNNGVWEFPAFDDMKYTDILFYLVFSMILTGISSFLTFFCTGIYWSYSVLLQNSERKEW